MSAAKIVVTGATGNIGQPLVQMLIERGFAPRVVVRKVERRPAWEAAGFEQTVADANDLNALTEAFAGAEKVFSLAPLVENFIEQGQVFIKAAQNAGVKRIVRSSAQGAGVDAPLTMWKWHGAVEKAIEDSGINWTFVQPASFFQNYLGFAGSIKSQNAFYLPLGDGKISLVDVRDIAAVACAALTEDGHSRKKYAVTGGESLSGGNIAQIFSGVLGREIKYVDVSEDAARQQMLDAQTPEWMVNAVMELN